MLHYGYLHGPRLPLSPDAIERYLFEPCETSHKCLPGHDGIDIEQMADTEGNFLNIALQYTSTAVDKYHPLIFQRTGLVVTDVDALFHARTDAQTQILFKEWAETEVHDWTAFILEHWYVYSIHINII